MSVKSGSSVVESKERVMQGLWKSWFEDENGATSIEYALIAAFLSLAVISGAQAIGLDLANIFGNVSATL